MLRPLRTLLLGCALMATSVCVFAAPRGAHKPTERAAARAEKNNQQAEPAAEADPVWQTNAAGKKYRMSAPPSEADTAQPAGMLLPSIQYNVQDIYFLSPPQFPPRLGTTSTIFEGQKVLTVPILRRYAIDEDDRVEVLFRAEALQPDGETETGPADFVLFSGKIRADGQLLFPVDSIPIFYTDKEQETGTYTLRTIISDQINGEETVLEQKINVIPYKEPKLPAGFDANEWMKTYYLSPEPELALPALYAMMREVPQERFDNATASIFGFYNTLLANNQWLLPYFSQRLEQALNKVREGDDPDNADIMLGLALSFHLRDKEEKPETISERIWEETQSNRQFDWSYTDPYGSDYIYYPQQLDYLWGEFFASGSYRPVGRLLGTLFQDKEAAAAATPDTLQHLNPEQRQTLAEAVNKAAQWSLLANAREQRQVLAYLFGTAMSRENPLPEADLKQLQAMLHAIIQSAKESQETAQPSEAPAK